MVYEGDVHKITTFDGEELVFPDESNRLLAYIGYGAPPIEFITQRGYKQHGETKLDYLLSPRAVTLELWQKPACDRATYWQNRLALHNLLRPNRGGPLELTLIIPDGTQRSILLDPNPGAIFDTPQTDDNNWSINETLDFIAFNPIWYNADATVLSLAEDADQDLIFPITFPIFFGPGGVTFTADITYTGTWQEYPILTIEGPYNTVDIVNVTTGAVIGFFIPILPDQSRIVTLTPGGISVVDQDGVKRFDELTAESNLVDFVINPDPIAPGGVNELQARMTGVSSETRFIVTYRERFHAI